ncbi:hypothetical protein RUM43_006821 [Polyplax serrata]|uniref:Protein-cysteine N-palmitoyltransferase Rasp n=1 Tax=Polyplax serrata TaxID=468196 RepID=A0AAN8S8D1_POLSC
MVELPRLEILTCCLIWISGIAISLYRLFLVGHVFDHEHHDQYHYEDFKKGWSLLGNRYQDQADYEWNTWTRLFIHLTPFLIINIIGAECLRTKKLWYALPPDIWFVKNDEDQYLVMVSSSWMVLRCISYSTDKIEKLGSGHKTQGLKVVDVFVLLGYSFYLPTMFCGPFISFCYFDEAIKDRNLKWTSKRVLSIVKDFTKCIFWYFFTIFALHYIYVNAILLRPDFVKHLHDWELAGLGIAMGHFFHLKYIVFYGIPCAWASAEGFTTPKLPCCVSRVHLYSYMWRHFDQGLYQFLVRYIYVPIISHMKGGFTVRKILASIGCFTFMFTWHRAQDYVFFWVLFNFIAVTIELLAKQIWKLSIIERVLRRNLSLQNQIRFQCILAAPLHCFSMISNYFFIGNGMEIGLVYLTRIITCSLQTKLIIMFFLYGAGQSAVAAQNREKKEHKSKEKTT